MRARFPLAHDRRGRRGILQPLEPDAIKVGRFLGFRQAIKTAEVATVGDTDPQVADDAPVRIGQEVGPDHLGGAGAVPGGEGAVAGGVLVAVGTIFAPPDCLISTLRS